MLERNKDWLIILGLMLLSIVPAVGGAFRLIKIGMGDSSLENARFLASPVPIFLHVFSATVYSLLGALKALEAGLDSSLTHRKLMETHASSDLNLWSLLSTSK